MTTRAPLPLLNRLAHSVLALSLLQALVAANPGTASQRDQIRILAHDYFQEENLMLPQRARARGVPTSAAFEENRPAERAHWVDAQARILSTLQQINERDLRGTEEWIAYGVLRETLESSVARERACGYYHARVTQVSGLSDQLELSARTQPLGSPELRRAAVTQWSRLPQYLQVEMSGLRDELDHGYSAPKSIVRLVIRHLDEVLSAAEGESPYAEGESPYLDPIRKVQDPVFTEQWRAAYRTYIRPGLQSYRNFLAGEYLERARQSISISALPHGEQCYEAMFRSYTTASLPANKIFELGQRTVEENQSEMTRLALETYGDGDIAHALRRLHEGGDAHFSNPDDLLEFSRATVDRARILAVKWFPSLSAGELLVRPYPAALDRPGAPATYQLLPSHRQGLFRIPLAPALEMTKARAEITAAHEAIPGHHIERWMASKNPDEQLKVLQSLNLGYVEGWARYAEGLAEQMDLYTQPGTPILRRSWIGRGMVVDSGIHLRNWTRERALAYMLESGYFLKNEADAVLERMVALPARATAYDYGGLEFLELRKNAAQAMGNCFDIRDFHRRVLEHGPMPFWMLHALISAGPPDGCEQNPR